MLSTRNEGSRSRGASANVNCLNELNEEAPAACSTGRTSSSSSASSPRSRAESATISPRGSISSPRSPALASPSSGSVPESHAPRRHLLRMYMLCLVVFGCISVGILRSNLLAFGADPSASTSTLVATGTGAESKHEHPIFRSQKPASAPTKPQSSPLPLDLEAESHNVVKEQELQQLDVNHNQIGNIEETDREQMAAADVPVAEESQDSSEVQDDADLLASDKPAALNGAEASTTAPTSSPTPVQTSQTSAPTLTLTSPTPTQQLTPAPTKLQTPVPVSTPTPPSTPQTPTPSSSPPPPTPTPVPSPTPATESLVLSRLGTTSTSTNTTTSTMLLTWTTPKVSTKCFRERDFGLLDELRDKARHFCRDTGSNKSPLTSTSISSFDISAGLKATTFSNLMLDLTHAQISFPIKSIAEDGAHHDPRFVFHRDLVHCACHETLIDANNNSNNNNKPIDLWDRAFTKLNARMEPSAMCLPSATWMPVPLANSPNDVIVKEKAILLARKDDHNPFFQISAALNAWILLQALRWDPAQTRLVQLDAGYDTPTDELQKRVLSPNFDVLKGSEMMGKRLFFQNDVLLAPYEVSGPMMQHLNDFEPCQDSQLLTAFRHLVLSKFDVAPEKTKSTTRRGVCSGTVTIITRRDYDGRAISRRWLNEDEVVAHMRQKYASSSNATTAPSCDFVFQSIEFVGLSMQKQVEIIKDSDLVIGMHGAGMVNVLWTRPGTMVIEIFPKKRRRWGYRNLCQFIGCEWREFRGGQDTGEGDNKSDKSIPVDEWLAFFDPIFQTLRTRLSAAETPATPTV